QLVGHVGEELGLVTARRLEQPALVGELAEEPSVLDRQHRLSGEGLEEAHDLSREMAGLAPPYDQAASDPVLEEERNREERPIAKSRQDWLHLRGDQCLRVENVGYLDGFPDRPGLAHGALPKADGCCPK